jgi:hypothetical protein
MLRKIWILSRALVFEMFLKLCLCKEMQRNFFDLKSLVKFLIEGHLRLKSPITS